MRRSGTKAAILAALMAIAVALFAAPGAGAAVTLPEKFEDQTVWGGLNKPMIVKFAPDGEVFVGEKGGQIWVYENVNDQTPELFANLAEPVYDYEDHGLLGMAIDPLWSLGQRYVYVLYTYNHKLEDKATQAPLVTDPRAETLAWPEYKGPPGSFEEDKCPEGEEFNKKEIPQEKLGCEVSGLVVKLKADPAGNHAEPSAEAPNEEVLLEGWCQQATTHSVGDLGFGPEGALYVSGGEGAMYSEADYGQFGNPCEDPVEYESPGVVKRLTALGGSLRSQSVMRDHEAPYNYPTLLSGAVLRVNPSTGEGIPGNPFYSSSEPNAKRIVAFGFRQPWRFTIDQRLGELYVSNVGNGSFEEIERLTLGSSAPYNGGWPCYEGGENGKPVRNNGYAGESSPGHPEPSIQYCIDQFKAEEEGHQQTETPFYSYPHNGPAVPGDLCYQGKPLATDVSGNVFNEGTAYSRAYHDAFFFSDAIRGCLYVMQSGPDGKPNPETATTFLSSTEKFSFPGVDMEQGPEGNIFYVQLFAAGGGPGSIHRIVYTGTSEKEEIEREEKEQREREAKEQREREEKEARERKEREERERKEKESTPPVTPPPSTYAPPQIKKRPGKTTTQLYAKFVFAGQGETKFRCKLDGKGFSSCRSPRTYKNLKVGKHSFRVYAVDAAGARLTKNRLFQWEIVRKS